jgi:hypothetical protein
MARELLRLAAMDTKTSRRRVRLDPRALLVLLVWVGACGGPEVVVTSPQRADIKASDQPRGEIEDAGGGKGEGPAPFLVINIDGTVPPGDTAAFCRLAPVERELDVTRVIHFSANLPGTVQVMRSPVSADGAKAFPDVQDCSTLGVDREEPFYVSVDSVADTAIESGSVHLAAGSSVLVEYDVTNPGQDTVRATATVLLDVASQ